MKHFVPWLGAAAILVIIFGTMYAVVQQDQRSAANSPQIQLAEDTAQLLNQGMDPTTLTPGATNLSRSLAPFVNIYDMAGNLVSGSGNINGHIPTPPSGLLNASNNLDYHAETWEPSSGVRIAAVVVKADKYYVLAGRSIREVEINETRTLDIAAAGGLASVIVLSVVYFSVRRR